MDARGEGAGAGAVGAVTRVYIVDGREPHVLIRELLTHDGAGTMIERAGVLQS